MTEEENFLIQSAGDNKSYSKDRVIDVLRNYGADKRYEGILEAEDEVEDLKHKLRYLKEQIDSLDISKEEAMENPNVVTGFGICQQKALDLIDKYLEEK